MQITLNGERQSLEKPCTLAELLEKFPPAHSAYAIEVNKQLIPRREHANHVIAADDTIEVVTLVGGG